MTEYTEIVLTGGDRVRVEGDAEQVEADILAAARGSLMQLAWMTEAQTRQRVGVNPEHVMMLRSVGAVLAS